MKEENRDRLGSFFKGLQDKRKAEQETRDESDAKREASYAGAQDVLRKIVHPTLAEMKEEISKYGEVHLSDELDGRFGPTVTFRFTPSKDLLMKGYSLEQSLLFGCSNLKDEIAATHKGIGSSTYLSIGTSAFSKVSPEWVEKMAIQFVETATKEADRL